MYLNNLDLYKLCTLLSGGYFVHYINVKNDVNLCVLFIEGEKSWKWIVNSNWSLGDRKTCPECGGTMVRQ